MSKEYGSPRVLLIATLRWPLAARMAVAFDNIGCSVVALCPHQHPVGTVKGLKKCYRHSFSFPVTRIRRVVARTQPDLIVPCDDEATVQLHNLYRVTPESRPEGRRLRELLRLSLGSPECCSAVIERGRLMSIAKEEGLRIPESRVVHNASQLERATESLHFPAVLKSDYSWGGQGVRIVKQPEEAAAEYDSLSSRHSIRFALIRLMLDRDPSFLMQIIRPVSSCVTLQEFVKGVPGNIAVAAWQGKVIASIAVRAVKTQNITGPATVVRVLDHPEMLASASRIVARLKLSGFWGFDFMLEEGSENAYLIEANPRATPIAHLALGPGHDLPSALCGKLTGKSPVSSRAPQSAYQSASARASDSSQRVMPVSSRIIALFPTEWQRDPGSPYLRLAYYDVPWEELALVRECIDKPWSERGILARLWSSLRPLIKVRRDTAVKEKPKTPSPKGKSERKPRLHPPGPLTLILSRRKNEIRQRRATSKRSASRASRGSH